MSQSPKEQTDIAMWNVLSEELNRLEVTQTHGREIAEITNGLANAHGYPPVQVMEGLLEGVQKGFIIIDGEFVRLAPGAEMSGHGFVHPHD